MKQFLNPNTIANDARMRRSIFKGAFLIVEGESDEKFFRLFVDSDSCQILIAHGKDHLIEVCRLLANPKSDGYLGIMDADFLRAVGLGSPSTDILLTDFHDLECYLLRSPAFDRVLGEFADSSKLTIWKATQGESVREILLQESAHTGLLLWHSLDNALALHFDNLEVKEFANRDSLKVDPKLLIKHLKDKSQRHDLSSAELEKVLAERNARSADLWQVVRGHDLVELLGYGLRRAWGNWAAQEVSLDRLEQSLRLAYPSEEFAKTSLFQAIKDWEQQNLPFVILKVNATGALLRS